ncbi:hypothetical protein [Phytohabitans rumicis]|uniref:Uncharacterized protein n=1 Tax=Phytohabitans rumicis TaxID=1076125 RepID=A0A6V8LCX0_9ACTN|nr:hypothetical protein [Phytohabitans rumicis]GFJ91936.1 hypothetical protein Prum_055780 [Phytohabitans rumicis]
MSDPSQARPRIVGPLLIALVLLAVIGGSVGFILAMTGDSSPPRSSPSSPSYSPSPSSTPAARCPASTEELAGRELTQVLYLRTALSEVWICADADGTLFYQGHAGQPGEELVDKENALFLTDVEQTDYGYRARNSAGGTTTEYRVSPDELIIQPPKGSTETQPAVES